MKIIVATNNHHKVSEFRALLANTGLEVFSMQDVGIKVTTNETGLTYEENAALKAEAIRKYTDELVIADDSGLEIEALENFPGLNSARYANQMGGNKNANRAIIDQMKNVTNRRAKFVAVIALCNFKSETLLFRGESLGQISQAEEGTCGFGYDPIFFSNEAQKSFALLDGSQKNRFSHRGKAVAKLIKFLIAENAI